MTPPNTSITVNAILIAAGASNRLGQSKQLVKFRGDYLINYIIQEINKSEVNDLVVVLGAKNELIQKAIKSKSEILINDDWASGMSSSIIKGINSSVARSSGVLISLVDQYYLNTALINELIMCFRNNSNKVIVSKYSNDKIGPPVIFPKSWQPQLQDLNGDRGAGFILQSLMKNSPEKIEVIKFPNGHLDIDIPEDLNNLS